MKPLITLIRIIIVGICWSIFFLEGIRVILLTNWHFDLIDIRHWRYVWDLWTSGWVIDDSQEWAFILIILSFIPLWLTGWASLSMIKWETYIQKLWKILVELYNIHILKKEPPSKSKKEEAPKPVIKRKKSYKEIRPRNLSSLRGTQAESTPAPSPIANNRTLPNVKPLNTTPAVPSSSSILDHSLFKLDNEDNDFDLSFDDLDKIESKPQKTEHKQETSIIDIEPEKESKPEKKPLQSSPKSERPNNKDKDHTRTKDGAKDGAKKANKPLPMSTPPQNMKNIGNSSLEIIKQKGYQVITSATIKNNFVDFIGVADNQLCICLVDKESGDWLADEERFNDEEPLWFSESSHRISPVRSADIVQSFLSQKLKENGFEFDISTFVIIQYGNIINAEDMFETWKEININVTRIDRGTPRELKLFAKTLDDAEKSIDIERFEKIKKLIRNLV